MLNSVQLIGRIGKDPEVRHLGDNKAVANFSVATTERWKSKSTGEFEDKTTWHNCVAWSPLAEIIEKYGHKGQQVYVQGKIVNSSYEKEGVTHYKSEIEIKEYKMLGTKDSNAAPVGDGSQGEQAPTAPAAPLTPSGQDDLPF